MLRVSHLHKSFGGVKAVNDCSFTVKPNTITALIGPNGAGKSTVFNLISGVNKADSGQILFKDQNMIALSAEQIANAGISRVFQHPKLFPNLTVEENLSLAIDNKDLQFWANVKKGAPKNNPVQIKAVLEKVKLDHFTHKQASELSFGQKRLVELCRALLKPHDLLLLDEPVGGVTPALRTVIAHLLVQLKKEGETILLIEHDMNFTLKITDEVIVMDEGKVICQDKPAKIRKNKQVIEAYLGD